MSHHYTAQRVLVTSGVLNHSSQDALVERCAQLDNLDDVQTLDRLLVGKR